MCVAAKKGTGQHHLQKLPQSSWGTAIRFPMAAQDDGDLLHDGEGGERQFEKSSVSADIDANYRLICSTAVHV
jgi:hypothetical protein